MEVESWGVEWVIDYCDNCEQLVDQDMDAYYVEGNVSVIWFCERCGTENEYRRYVGD
jgi:RNase P subunit RPR2